MKCPAAGHYTAAGGSLPVRGAWIEISARPDEMIRGRCRSPCGERGLKCRLCSNTHGHSRRSPCGERGLKCRLCSNTHGHSRRSPCGERGLKSMRFRPAAIPALGRSPCGERGLKWQQQRQRGRGGVSRSPCGERGLKWRNKGSSSFRNCRSPCGERGLKSPCRCGRCKSWLSLPVRGAWIEILLLGGRGGASVASLPVRGAWIEITREVCTRCTQTSLPVRGAWIEISAACDPPRLAPRRSPCGERGLKCLLEADRICNPGRSPCGERGLKSALHPPAVKESGRSPCGERGLKYNPWTYAAGSAASLPVRGAWIEIQPVDIRRRKCRVAPRAGSVD